MITTSVPANTRTPGSFVEFDITSAARGLVALTRRVALLGMKSASGTLAVATPTQVFTEAEGDAYAGKNSELALMVRAAMKAGRKAGKMPEIWIVAIAAPAGVATTKTFTVTGTATAAGDIVFRIAGRTLRAAVAVGDVQNTIAASIKSAIDAQAATGDLPVIGSVATNVATVTFPTTGVNGNDLAVSVVSSVAGVTVVAAAGVTGTGTVDITASLDVLQDKHYNAVAIANHTSTDVSDLAAYYTARGAAGVKKWAFGFMAETGTLATATSLATAANTEYTVVVACEGCLNMTGEIAAQVAVARFAETDPSLTMSGTELDLYAPAAASVFTPGSGGEVESALAGGVTPLSVKDGTGAVYIVRLVTTKTTLNSAPYDMLRDFNVAYTLTWMGEQADATVAVFMSDPKNKKNNGGTRKRMRSKLLDMLRAAEGLSIVQNVEAHKGEVQVESHPTVPTRVLYDLPVSVVPGLEQASGVLRLMVEGFTA